MKQRILTTATALLLYASIALAQQGVRISDGPGSPDPTAILDIESTTKGVLLPRMTTGEMLDISGAATGLMIFNIDDNSVYINRGTQTTPDWVNTTAPDMAVGFLVYADGGQPINANQPTQVLLNVTFPPGFNDGNYYDEVGSFYVVPYDGVYQFHANITIFNLDPGAAYEVAIYVDDGSGTPVKVVSNISSPPDYMNWTGAVSATLKLTGGESVYVYVTQKSQSTYSLSSIFLTTWFSGYRLY